MNNEDFDWDYGTILKRLALWGGVCIAAISIYFSYDGLDQVSNGGNPTYAEIAQIIGWVMAIVVTLIQFIFNSDFNKLSPTLRIVGLVSYGYSMYTNYISLEHLFGFTGFVGFAISVFMDVTPEAMIAWALEDVTQGDMVGNIGKMFMGVGRRSGRRNQNQNRPQTKQYTFTPEQKHTDTQPRMPAAHMVGQAKKGKGREFYQKQGNKSANRFEGMFKDDE
jgi:hypothetical protein